MTPNARTPLRIGIVGAGLMGRWHADAAKKSGATVSVICDKNVAAANHLARRYGARATGDFEHLVSLCDVVHVCTPLDTHYSLCMFALTHDCSVICEKPMTDNVALTTSLVTEATRRRVTLVPTHQFLFQRGVRIALVALESLGPVLHMDTIACTAGAARKGAPEAEQVATDIVPHPLSLFERFCPGILDRADWHVAPGAGGEIRATATSGSLSLGMLVSCSGRPPVNAMRVIAEKGTVSIDLFHGFATVDRQAPSRSQKILQPFISTANPFLAATLNLTRRLAVQEWAYPGLRELVSRTYDAVIGGGPSPIGPQEIVAVASAGERIRIARNRELVPDAKANRDNFSPIRDEIR